MIHSAAPFDLDAIRRELGDDAGLQPIGIRELVIRSGALDALVPAMKRLVPTGTDVVVLVDHTPIRRGDQDLKATVAALLGADFNARLVAVGSDGAELHADEVAAGEADRAVVGDQVAADFFGDIFRPAGVAPSRC